MTNDSGVTPSEHGFSAALRAQEAVKSAQERMNKAGAAIDAAYDELISSVHAYATARTAQRLLATKLNEPRGLSAAEAPTSVEGVNNGG